MTRARAERDVVVAVFHELKTHFYSMLHAGDKLALAAIALVAAAFVVAAVARAARR